jgi:phosphoribosylanthranilate isomerase
VDASSRLEEGPGKKDSALVREFILKAKAVDIKSE